MLVPAHSGLRWIALILIIVAIFNALSKKKSGIYTEGDRKLNLFSMIAFHTQFLIGLVLYFISPKVQFIDGWMHQSMYRFFGMEHALLMVFAFILITIGHSKSKKVDVSKKHGIIATFYTIALLLILAGIPWPFRAELGGSWF